jgi:hypothetical protein
VQLQTISKISDRAYSMCSTRRRWSLCALDGRVDDERAQGDDSTTAEHKESTTLMLSVPPP